MEHIFLRERLKIIKEPTDVAILNQLAKYMHITDTNTVILHSTSELEEADAMVKNLYIDVSVISWSELEYIVGRYPNVSHLILRAHDLLGGANRMLNIINNYELSIFAVLVKGSYCSNIVNSSVFLRDWDNHVHGSALHIYFQEGTYNRSVQALSHELDKLLVLGYYETDADPELEPIEILVTELMRNLENNFSKEK